jgi:hypothetical protein
MERVDLMLKTTLSKSARDDRRACASSAVRGTAVPTKAGAILIVVVFICVAMFVRQVLITGTAKAVALEADIDTILHQQCSHNGRHNLLIVVSSEETELLRPETALVIVVMEMALLTGGPASGAAGVRV